MADKAVHKAGRFQKGDSRINRTKPGTGRPPDAFKAYCQQIASTGAVAAERVLKMKHAEDHPAFLGALKWATEHGYGKPKETRDVNLSGSVQVAFTRETRKKTAS